MKKTIISILALFTAGSLYASSTGSCWNSEQKADLELAELSEKIKFSFKDAKSCEPIANAKVNFAGQDFYTDHFGELTLPTPPEELDAKLPLIVSKEGYITLKQKVQASIGSFWQNRFLVTKDIPIKSARFILGWGSSPRDLDLHLASEDFHISYRNKKGSAYLAKLDRDSMKGYGPETITLNHLDRSKKYKLYVYNYSNEKPVSHSANISIYTNNKLNKATSFPDGMSGRCIQIATIFNNKVEYNFKTVSKSNCK